MNYWTDAISKLDTKTIGTYEIYKIYGTGVMEDPHYEKADSHVSFVTCSEFEAWLIAAYYDLQLHGPMLKRSSWESPNYNYRKLENDTN